MFSIEWERKAVKQLLKLGHKDRKVIFESVDNLCDWPNCRNIKALKDQRYTYRLRVGRFRVLFDVEKPIKIIKIEEVKKRNERTY